MANPYKDEDYQYKPVDYYDNTDVGADRSFLSPESQATVRAFKNTWAEGDKAYKEAEAAGDQAGMDAAKEVMEGAHAGAEEERAKYGYQGGANGGAYNPLAGSATEGGGADGGEKFTYERAPEYVEQYDDLINAATKKIMDRPAFSYDPETDPSYQQYKEQYTRQGKLAMEDTLGQVSARTGGLASSYAGSAAQQSYNQYMSALSDKIPELRQLAYEMYRDEGDDMRADLNMLLNLDQRRYGRYQDKLGQFNTDRSFKYGAWSDQKEREYRADETAYQRGRDALADQRYDDETAYARAQDKYNKDLAAGEYMAGVGQFGKLAQTLGLSEAETQALVDEFAWQKNLTREEAARQVADWYAQYGDLSKLKELGVDTGYLEKQREPQVVSVTPKEEKAEEKPSPQYDKVVREISRLEDTGFKDEVKISKIIDEVERAQKKEEISPDEAKKILSWYGL